MTSKKMDEYNRINFFPRHAECNQPKLTHAPKVENPVAQRGFLNHTATPGDVTSRVVVNIRTSM